MPIGNANSAKFILTVEGYATSDFTVTKFCGSDAVSAPFSFDIEFQRSESVRGPGGEGGDPSPSLLCRPCSLTLIRDGNAGSAVYSGVVRGFAKMHRSAPVYSIRLVPWIELLSLNINNRVFQKRTVVEIIEEVVQGAGLAGHCDIRCKSTYPQIDFCVQYGESDLNFISRLMEREGIWYYFGDGGCAVITDAFSEFPAMAAEIPFVENIGFAETSKKRVDEDGEVGAEPEAPVPSGEPQSTVEEEYVYSAGFGESVYSLTSKTSVFPGSVRLRNQNYRTPETMPEGLCSGGEGQSGRWGSVYEYGGTFKTKEEGDRLAELSIRRRQVENSQTEGKSRCAALRAGAIIRIKPGIGEFLLVSVEHKGGVGGIGADGGEYTYNNTFLCIDTSAKSYAPPLRAAPPTASGLITATVEALGEEHPNVDEVGRYRVKLPFDLSEKEAYASTKDIRLSQISGSEGYGVHFATKEGGEMLLGYVDGNPDKPVGLGFVPNAKAISVVNNGNRDQNVIRTWGQNQIVMDDTPEDEKILVSTPKGNRIEMEDKPEAESISVMTQGGNQLVMDDKPNEESISIITKGGNQLVMDDDAEKKGVITLATKASEKDTGIQAKAYNAAMSVTRSNLKGRADPAKLIPGFQYLQKETRNSELSLNNEECTASLRAWKQEIALAYDASHEMCGITLSTANKLEIAMDDIMRTITLETKRGNSLEINDLKNNIVISNAKNITNFVKDTIGSVGKAIDTAKKIASGLKGTKARLNELRDKAQANVKEHIKGKIKELKKSPNSIIIETDGGKIVLTTASGCMVEIDQKSDSIAMKAPGNITINAGGTLSISAQKDIFIRGRENMTITSEKRTAIKGKNEMAVTGTAARIQTKRGGVKVSSEGNVELKGPAIHLNKPGAKRSGDAASGGKGQKNKGSNENTNKMPHRDNAEGISSNGSSIVAGLSASKASIAATGVVGAGAVAANAGGKGSEGAALNPQLGPSYTQHPDLSESEAPIWSSSYWGREEPKREVLYKLGSSGSVVLEINIRLAGFGGMLPTNEFTTLTEKGVRQFKTDYMGLVNPTGDVDMGTLEKIDEFSNKWCEDIVEYKCLCHASNSPVKQKDRCSGYGDGKKNERPGIHRSLLWGVSALKYYLSQQTEYKYDYISAGYRCNAHNIAVDRKTINHMGLAVDIHFNYNNGKTPINRDSIDKLKKIRDEFLIKHLKAVEGWEGRINSYRLEPIGTGKDESYSWIHIDVMKFESQYTKDEFFVKKQSLIKGELSI